jgi:hypothetical protein
MMTGAATRTHLERSAERCARHPRLGAKVFGPKLAGALLERLYDPRRGGREVRLGATGPAGAAPTDRRRLRRLAFAERLREALGDDLQDLVCKPARDAMDSRMVAFALWRRDAMVGSLCSR